MRGKRRHGEEGRRCDGTDAPADATPHEALAHQSAVRGMG